MYHRALSVNEGGGPLLNHLLNFIQVSILLCNTCNILGMVLDTMKNTKVRISFSAKELAEK